MDDDIVNFVGAARRQRKSYDPVAQEQRAGMVRRAMPLADRLRPSSGGPLPWIVYLFLAVLSPWFWLGGLVAWPIVAYFLPRDDEGGWHWRWAAYIAFAGAYIVSYIMVAVGAALLPSALKLMAVL